MTALKRAALLSLLSIAGACAPMYMGKSETLRADAFEREPGWTAVEGVPELRQKTEVDCGPVALTMVTRYWQPAAHDAHPDAEAHTPLGDRVSAGDLRDAARALGYKAYLVEGTLNDLEHELSAKRPAIVGMAKPTSQGALGHYEVVVGLNKDKQLIATLDPALGPRRYSFEAFLHEWIRAGRPLLVLLGPPASAPAPPPASPPPPPPPGEPAPATGDPPALSSSAGSRS